jgi:predicted nucleotidyltransferase/DNA-binding XRE family transcriptional regulator
MGGKYNLKKTAKHIAEKLNADGITVSNITVFGSQAKGTADSKSDIDMVIVSDAFKGKNLIERGRMISKAEKDAIRVFDAPFDILTMTGKEYRSGGSVMAVTALQEGTVVYGGESNLTAVSEKLASLRMKKNISQRELSKRTKIPQQEISNIEKGRRNITIETLEKMAGGLGAKVNIMIK